jgi:hypothetical protein
MLYYAVTEETVEPSERFGALRQAKPTATHEADLTDRSGADLRGNSGSD